MLLFKTFVFAWLYKNVLNLDNMINEILFPKNFYLAASQIS